MGTMAMMVEATPVVAYFTAMREKETPRNGPKTEPIAAPVIPERLLKAFLIRFPFRRAMMMIAKPIMPAMILICVAAKA